MASTTDIQVALYWRRIIAHNRRLGHPRPARTSQNAVNAKFAQLKPQRPTPIGQGRRRRDVPTVGYYAPEQLVISGAFLGVWGGAKRRAGVL